MCYRCWQYASLPLPNHAVLICLVYLQVLADLLTGKRVQLSMSESSYWRKFAGESSPGDLESGLQLVHKLFSHKVTPNTQDLQTVML